MKKAKNDICPVWQEVGASTHIIAAKLAEKLKTKTSHTGTLDPMASGVVIILAGDTRLKKYEYAYWLKEYEFEILFGFETSSLDLLGIPKKSKSKKEVTREALLKVLNGFVGEYSQRVPAFSAIKIKGKPMWWYARTNKLAVIEKVWPVRSGTIHELKLKSLGEISSDKLLRQIKKRIGLISGEFNQEETLKAWDKLLRDSNTVLTTAKIKVVMTKVLYVRKLVEEICEKCGVKGTTLSIVRTRNGEYSKRDCVITSTELLFK